MPQYDFSTLNDKDLENLSRDLLSKELDVPFQSFKVGKDKGIDLRYSTPFLHNDIVVQVKHYYKSGCSVLKSKLKKDELPKVLKLNPRRYIIVTSVSLSPTDKEAIMDIMSPYILSTGDIYGADDINNLNFG